MRLHLFLSHQLSELVNFLNSDVFKIDFIEHTLDVLQIYFKDIPTATFIFSSNISEDIFNFLREIQGKKTIISISSDVLDENISTGIIELGIDYMEMSSMKEFAEFLEVSSKIMLNSRENDDFLMLQRQDEVFKPNQV